jgi:hypothetical protein
LKTKKVTETLARLGVPSVAVLIAVGTFWSYTRGGIDFAVFHHAWRLVLEGRGSEIYVNSPDRYLYAPGFAWLFAPLGLLPKPLALAVWCLLKAVVIGYLIQRFSRGATQSAPQGAKIALCAWAVWVVSRPILIDLQYGQINLLILGVAVWALSEHFSEHLEKGSSSLWKAGVSWFLLGVLAISKIFPTPLMMVPWLRAEGASRQKLRIEKTTSILGALLTVIVPVISQGYRGALQLVFSWREALVEKGLPYESHNQSFTAALHHYFTTDPTHIISLGSQWVVIGKDLLSLEVISMLSMGWTFVTAGFLLAWILKGSIRDPLRWIAVVVALLFVPSHLVWKPYFVFGLPAAMLIITAPDLTTKSKAWILGSIFVLMNLTGFDMIGGFLAGRLEAASLFLWVHLWLIGVAIHLKPVAVTAQKT